MKKFFVIALIVTSSFASFAQSTHIEQSTPFENVLQALKSDSVDLFMNSFSLQIIDGNKDKELWLTRLNQGKEKFKQRFGVFQPSDFLYKYDKAESKLIVIFKGKEQFRISVIKEGNTWKLDQR